LLKKYYYIIIAIILSVFVGNGFAQFEDDLLFEEEEQVEITCVPDCLASNYDLLINAETSLMDIRQWYSFGSEYFKNKSYKAALPYLWKVFLNDSTKYARNAIRKIADSYFNLQKADSTLIASYRGLALFPDLVRLHYYAGYIQENLGKFQCAIPHYEALVESDQENEQYLSKLAFLYWKNADLRAIDVQKKLIDLYSDNNSYKEQLPRMISDLIGEGEELLKALKEAYDKDSENINNAYNYGIECNNQGKYLEALVPFSTIIDKLDSKNVKAFKARANSYESLEKYSLAVNDYKKVVEFEPDNVQIMCAIANVYRNQDQFSKGRYWINKALKAKPGYGLAYITMGEIYESAVTFCQKGRNRKYDDGLVYEMAYRQYHKALNDPAYKSIAKSRRNSLQPYRHTKEEKFMNQNRTTIKMKCYTSWIK